MRHDKTRRAVGIDGCREVGEGAELVICCGDNQFGNAEGNGGAIFVVFIAVEGKAVGIDHTCVIADGSAVCTHSDGRTSRTDEHQTIGKNITIINTIIEVRLTTIKIGGVGNLIFAAAYPKRESEVVAAGE